ncbi:MAG: hypothetical protein IJO79_02960 [Firmicutes bacterium]|nr:hypothetical protein [Bacillota bacterium]
MSGLFLTILGMSLSASFLVVAVLLFRFVLRDAPKWTHVLLWGIVAVRLICPVLPESPFSLLPESLSTGEQVERFADRYVDDTMIIREDSVYFEAAVHAGREPIPDGAGGYYVITKYDQLGEPETVKTAVLPILSVVWVAGMAAFAIHAAVSYFRLRRRVATAIILRDNVYQSERVETPFVLGLIKPRIYLPFRLNEPDFIHVLAHELAHIFRKDHWWKPIGYILLAIHWFNPLMWLAYILLCRDIELACDERVIRDLEKEDRADYSQALLACSLGHRMPAACPLAFGEVGVKARIRTVLKYKKPSAAIAIIAVAACILVAACFLTNPFVDREFPMYADNIADLEVETILEQIREVEDLEEDALILANQDNFDLFLTSAFDFPDDRSVMMRCVFPDKNGFSYLQLRIFADENRCVLTESNEWNTSVTAVPLQYYLEALKYLPQEAIRELSPDADAYSVMLSGYDYTGSDRIITYNAEGVLPTDVIGTQLCIQPMHKSVGKESQYHGSGDEIIHLFFAPVEFPSHMNFPKDTVEGSGNFYLTIGADNVSYIEFFTSTSSGGCSNADGSDFEKGETVWLEPLTGMEDLRGVTFVAYNSEGECLWLEKVSDGPENEGVTGFTDGHWTVKNQQSE